MMKANRALIVLGVSAVVLVGILSMGLWTSTESVPGSTPIVDKDHTASSESVDSVSGPGLRPGVNVSVNTDTVLGEKEIEAKLAGTDFASRTEDLLAAWQGAQARISALQARLERVEMQLVSLARERDEPEVQDRPDRPRNPDERRQALVSSGVDPVLADDIIWRESRLELDRLNLRDLAVREGWVGTDRYREELGQLAAEDRSVRDEIGDGAWDRYLYNTGEDNRIAVETVIPGSAAEAAGLQPGDLIEAYAGDRLFRYAELRDATTQGEVGELVAVRIRRGNGVLDAWVPRGPLGIRMGMTRAEPAP